MEDYSILNDEYFYIKEKAFKDIRSIVHSRTVQPANEYKNKENVDENEFNNESGNKGSEKKDRKPERQLFCPVDKSPLIRISLKNIFIDYCEKCFGLWLDFGELELLLQKQLDKTNIFKKIFQKKAEDNLIGLLLCPVCKVKLNKHKDFSSNTISDNCPVC
jgi:Zn-finger nucleic acid-binding protein